MFVFFSNRLGCLGSLAISAVGTLLIVLLLSTCRGRFHPYTSLSPAEGPLIAGCRDVPSGVQAKALATP